MSSPAIIIGIEIVVIRPDVPGKYNANNVNILFTLVLAVGFAAVGAKDIWSLFAPVWVRTYSVEQYSTINLRFSVAHFVGLYLISIALAVILLMKKGKSDNNVLQNTGTNAPDSQHLRNRT